MSLETPKMIVINVNVEPKYIPKPESRARSSAIEKKTIAAVMGATLLAGGIAIGSYASAETSSSPTSISTAYSAEQQKQAMIADLVESKAKATADAINKTIDNSGLVVTAPVLNGAIVRKYPSGSVSNDAGAPLYENAYLLYTPDTQMPDKAGNFLSGAWIGLSGKDATSEIVISPIQYDPNTMGFVANDNGDPVIDVSIMATPVNNLSGSSVYVATVAYGPAGNQNPQNNDGSPITPGLIVGK